VLTQALRRTRIAAVGAMMARAVEAAGGMVAMQPGENFHHQADGGRDPGGAALRLSERLGKEGLA